MGKHHQHPESDNWLNWSTFSKLSIISVLAFWLRYEAHIIDVCQHNDDYVTSKNVNVANSWACDQGEVYFAHLFSCSDVLRQIDAAESKRNRTACWFESHVFFQSWWTGVVVIVVSVYVLKLLLQYLLKSQRQQAKAQSRARKVARYERLEEFLETYPVPLRAIPYRQPRPREGPFIEQIE